MKTRPTPADGGTLDWRSDDYDEPVDRVEFDFERGVELSRRRFVQVLGAGLLITVALDSAPAQDRPRGGGRGGRGGGPPPKIAARLHIGKDGAITVLTGKVECGQGARAELTQAAAEELRVPVERIALVMADTGLVPNDGITAGSRSTPSTVPAIRQAAAAARELLVAAACKAWADVQPSEVEVADGKVMHTPSRRERSFADLASAGDAIKAFEEAAPPEVSVTPVKQWKVMGVSVPRPNRRDLVTGKHQFPSDVTRPGMLFAKVLRPPSYGATPAAIDLAPAKAMEGVVAVHDGDFVAVAAPTSLLAEDALDAVAATAKWEAKPHPPSAQLYDHLRRHARSAPANPFAAELPAAAKSLRQTYHVAYVQHAPMEPRAAVAEWQDSGVTVWTATQNPFGVRGELARAFQIPEEKVRVIVPDFGGGFGGKHSGETAVEAARIAKAAGKPVSLRWTREEEFTWAYVRPAAVIDIEASLDAAGNIASWFFVNINAGPSSIDTPYKVAKRKSEFVQSDAPLRHGSYRALAATANTFARECFMDELAAAAEKDPLAFRLAHLENERLRAVLVEAAAKFGWDAQSAKKEPNVGVGLACGTEKGSYVAACAEVEVDPTNGRFTVRRVCQAYECGAIVNPDNLRSQVDGCVLQGLGPALREETRFEGGRVTNANFSQYLVPRFADVPKLEIHLIDRPDLPSAGGSETPIIAVAPAIANAVSRAIGTRIREMPIRLPKTDTDAPARAAGQ